MSIWPLVGFLAGLVIGSLIALPFLPFLMNMTEAFVNWADEVQLKLRGHKTGRAMAGGVIDYGKIKK